MLSSTHLLRWSFMKLADAPYGSAIVGQWEMFRGAVSSFVFPLDYRANSYNINLFWDWGSMVKNRPTSTPMSTACCNRLPCQGRPDLRALGARLLPPAAPLPPPPRLRARAEFSKKKQLRVVFCCLVFKKNLQYLFHQIFGHMHRTLNAVKK